VYPGFCISVFSLFFWGLLYYLKKWLHPRRGPSPKKKGEPDRGGRREGFLYFCIFLAGVDVEIPTMRKRSRRNLGGEIGASGGGYCRGELRAQREGPALREGTRTAALDDE